VSAGKRLLASHAVTVPAGKLRRGVRVDTWRWTPTRHGRLTFAASVTVVAPAGGALGSVTQSSSTGFTA
jgi:hypothetical protein